MPDGRQVSSASSKTGVSPVLKIDFYNDLEYIIISIINIVLGTINVGHLFSVVLKEIRNRDPGQR